LFLTSDGDVRNKLGVNGCAFVALRRRVKLRQLRVVLLALLAVLVAQAQYSPVSIEQIESLIRSRQYDEAVRLTDAALHARPSDFRIWTLQGVALSAKDNRAAALKAFQKALSFSPDYLPALRGEVDLFYQTQDDRAIPVLEQLLRTAPDDETAHEMLAVLEAKKRKCQEAVRHFLRSTGSIARHPGSLELYGYCLQQTKQPEKAIPIFEQLAKLLPEQDYPKYDLAVLQVETNQNKAALQTLEPLLNAAQPDPDVLSLASQAYEATEDTPKAAAVLRRAIVSNPTNPDYYTAFSLICLDHLSYQVGIDMISFGIQQIPRNSSLYVSRGMLYSQLGDYEKAEADFNAAESMDSAQSLSSYAKDLMELEKNHLNLDVTTVRAQLKVHPKSASHHFLLAKLLEKDAAAGDVSARNEAISAALAAVKLRPDFVQARDVLASLYLAARQFGLAKQQSELALKQDPYDEPAIYHLISALRHSASPADRQRLNALAKLLAEAQQHHRQQDLIRKGYKLLGEQPVQ
jgi:tetratricopeptide (TPR) repeat protein